MEYQKDYRSGSSYAQENTGSRSIGATTAAMYRHMYGWMTAALCITGLAAYFTADMILFNEAFRNLFISLKWLFILAPFGLVIWISAGINRMSFQTATLLFALYSAVMGISLAPIFLVYTMGSIAKVFFITAGTFGGMALYGHMTKADLSRIGNICIMALWGVILASLVNLFFRSATVEYIASFAGIAIFCGLTMWDVQKMKNLLYSYGQEANENVRKIALLGALNLYLDFINLFLYLLRFLGNSRD